MLEKKMFTQQSIVMTSTLYPIVDLDELKKEGAESRLTGEHVLLGGWLLDRDLSWISDGHELVAPHAVACHAEGESAKEVTEEDREKAKQIH